MSADHLVQIGIMGLVGRYQAADFCVYPRGAQVICRTARGLEVGSVLCSLDEQHELPVDGKLLRQVGSEDQLISTDWKSFATVPSKLAPKKLLNENLARFWLT